MAKPTTAQRIKSNNPIEIWKNDDGWTWKVWKKYQKNDDKPYARALCTVTSPFTGQRGDMGDCYITDYKNNAICTMMESEGE